MKSVATVKSVAEAFAEVNSGSGSLRFDGRTVIVTGGGSSGDFPGVGTAISALYAAQGANVAIVDLNEANAARTQELIAAEGGKSHVFIGDISDDGSASTIVGDVVRQFGGVDVLVNNAAVYGGGGIPTADLDAWHRNLAVNMTGAMLMSQHSAQHLQVNQGAIVNIASVAGLRVSGMVGYTASKAGMMGLTRDAAFTLGPLGIRVNCIAPSSIYTPASVSNPQKTRADHPARSREMRNRTTMLGTEGDGWDIAWATLFLSSPLARLITGVVLPVEGGAMLAPVLQMFDRLVSAPSA